MIASSMLARIIHLADTGMTAVEICMRMQCGYTIVVAALAQAMPAPIDEAVEHVSGDGWTDKADAVLRKLHAAGSSYGSIAEILGSNFTKNMVVGRVHRLNLVQRPNPVKRTEKPVARKAAGGCLYIAGDPRLHHGDFDELICGDKRQDGSSYCSNHHARCYQRWKPGSAAA